MNELTNWDDYSDYSDDNEYKYDENILKENMIKKFISLADGYLNVRYLINLGKRSFRHGISKPLR